MRGGGGGGLQVPPPPTWMMLVPFLKLLKERMTSWLRDSTATFQDPEKPRTNWVTRAGEPPPPQKI